MGTSLTWSTATGPYSSNRTAFIVASGRRFGYCCPLLLC
jgi:hypothetical protein